MGKCKYGTRWKFSRPFTQWWQTVLSTLHELDGSKVARSRDRWPGIRNEFVKKGCIVFVKITIAYTTFLQLYIAFVIPIYIERNIKGIENKDNIQIIG